MLTIPITTINQSPNMCGTTTSSNCPATTTATSASAAHNMSVNIPNGRHHMNQQAAIASSNSSKCYAFQMPLHYPRFKKADYEKMPEPQLDCLLREYGLPTIGDLNQKRKFAMGAFLWPDEYN